MKTIFVVVDGEDLTSISPCRSLDPLPPLYWGPLMIRILETRNLLGDDAFTGVSVQGEQAEQFVQPSPSR